MEIVKFEGQEGMPKVVISPNVLKDIDFMHANYRNLEWSGVIFYSVDGSLEDPKNMSCLVHGFYLMDLGTSGFTKFDLNSNMPDIYMNNPEILENEWTMGLMHSHHSMPTFFSGEDTRVLHTNAEFYTQFLSLIVNVEGTYKAKISTVVEVSNVRKFENIPDIAAKILKKSHIEVYDCEIKKIISCEERFNELAKQKNLRFKDSFEERSEKPLVISIPNHNSGPESGIRKTWEEMQKGRPDRPRINAPSQMVINLKDEEYPKFDADFGVVERTSTGIPVDSIFENNKKVEEKAERIRNRRKENRSRKQ